MTGIIEFNVPTRVVYGRGAVNRLGEECRQLGLKQVLLVSDVGLRRAGISDS